jgi:hypothetical protein
MKTVRLRPGCKYCGLWDRHLSDHGFAYPRKELSDDEPGRAEGIATEATVLSMPRPPARGPHVLQDPPDIVALPPLCHGGIYRPGLPVPEDIGPAGIAPGAAVHEDHSGRSYRQESKCDPANNPYHSRSSRHYEFLWMDTPFIRICFNLSFKKARSSFLVHL